MGTLPGGGGRDEDREERKKRRVQGGGGGDISMEEEAKLGEAGRGSEGEEEGEGEDGWVYEGDEEDMKDSEEEEDDPDADVTSRILRAAERGDAALLGTLLGGEQGVRVDVNGKGEDGDTALHLACLYGRTECVQILLRAGASIFVFDEDNSTPLHDAAAGGFLAIVNLLLASAGGNEQWRIAVNTADADGDTPLHNAARGGHLSVAQRLLECGADSSFKNVAGETPSMLVESNPALEQLLQLS